MNSSIISVSEILNSAKSFTSAGFSAGYSFDEVNAAVYFDELIENLALPSPIFSGILIMRKLENAGENFTIIDGLQRLTTISLFLCALCENYKNTSQKNEEAKDKIFKRYLINENESKLNLLGEEQVVYKKILFSEELSENEMESNLFQAYKCFLEKIKSQKVSGTQLFNVVSKIQFMTVIADKSEIPARELYQALNDNKDESQINLISDFISQKGELAEKNWQKIIDLYKNSGQPGSLKSFIQDFLIAQNDDKTLNKPAIYNNFRSYFIKISKYRTPEMIMENMYKYSQYYLKIINADFENQEIKEQFIRLNQNEGNDSYSYLMEVLDDLENGHIDTGIFFNILIMINSFFNNRLENPLSNQSIDFSSLSKELNKMLVLDDYRPNYELTDVDENKLTINEINNLSTFGV